ncbi:unnamed protein product [Caenorhabditis auriculariae]|uniref:C-type lectin domain-containing protein n=1 Tax=Caenorhabditis auriculariae TaxID=2777116 RepID=A0A8S1HUK5_9PELO|nr:unnamed protein product [Caenorhabditis auriculariae]
MSILLILLTAFRLGESAVFRPFEATAAPNLSYEEPCSGFGHNWAGEIRCLRETLSQCGFSTQQVRSDRGGRSLPTAPTVFPPFTHELGGFSPGQTIYAARRSHSPSDYSSNVKPWRRPVPSSFPQPPVLQPPRPKPKATLATPLNVTSEPKINTEELIKNITTKCEKKLSEVRAAIEFEFRTRLKTAESILSAELDELRRSNDNEHREFNKRIDLLSARVHQFDGKEYAYMERREAWYDAEETCVGWGGHLASVESEKENSFIATLIKGDAAWIGLNDVQKENIFVNTDMKKTTFRAWKKGQPDNESHNENCVEVNVKGDWSDMFCLVSRPFICKR